MISSDEPRRRTCGVDIVKDDGEIVFQTANGSTSTSDVAKIVVDELDETVEPHVLDETPTVLSVGRRCMKMGYAFHWMPGKLPFMVTPKQGFVHLQVKDDIPYLVSDGKLRSNRHRPTIDDLKEHFSEVLAMVTNDETIREVTMTTTSHPPLSVSPQRSRANTTTGHSTSGHPEEPVRYVRLP